MSEGSLADKFKLVETLVGEGSVRTYRAQTADGRPVFVRAVAADPAAAQAALAAVPALMAPDAPASARVVDAGPVAGGYFLARDWVEGETLDAYLARPEVTPESAAKVVSDALAQLALLHRAGMVHGDVRPNSIIIGEAGAVSLVDAGLPAAATRRDEYTSPEESRGEAPGSASDIYRMGLVLCKALTGMLPLRADTPEDLASAHLNSIPALPSSLSAASPVAFDAVVLTALAKLPAERYADADRMREAIDAVLMPAAVVAEPEPKSKMWLWITIAIVVLLLLGGAWYAGKATDSLPAWLLFGATPQVAAPQVTGLPQADAEAAIVAAGLKVGKVTDEPTLEIAPGTVTTQTPSPGQKADEGSAVDLKVSSIPVVVVPKVVGDTQDNATNKLAQAGLRLGTVTYVYDAKVKAGYVTAQDPAGDATAAVGAAVGLTVSKGEQLGKVPSVVGLSQADAEAALSAAGFKSTNTKASSTSVPAGDVISQSPAAGAAATAGSTVALTVSSGAPAEPKVSVPNVVGKGVIQAIADIASAGLKVAIAWVPSDQPALKVDSQAPAAGTQVDKGSVVTISISLPKFLIKDEQPPATTLPAPAPTPEATTLPAPTPPAPTPPSGGASGTPNGTSTP